MAAPYGSPIPDPSIPLHEPSPERLAEIERFITQHLQERGFDRATLRHDVYCYERLFDMYQFYCTEMSARQALRSLPEPEARQIAAVLGSARPRAAPATRCPSISVPGKSERRYAATCCASTPC